MPLTTTVTPATIAIALGQSAPDSGSPTEAQWTMWIADALMLIQARVDSITPTPAVDAGILDYVIRQAVVTRADRPEGGAVQVSTSVDDASVSKTYRKTQGVEVDLGEWWAMLGLTTSTGRAFMVDLMPPGAGEVGETDYWWWT